MEKVMYMYNTWHTNKINKLKQQNKIKISTVDSVLSKPYTQGNCAMEYLHHIYRIEVNGSIFMTLTVH
jgi:hypothetical protein